MDETADEIVNVEQAAAWDGHEGDVWTDHADRYDRAARRIWQRFLEEDPVGGDDRVLDVGCGTGAPTRDLARLAEQGHVTGVDLSSRMLELARLRSAEAGITNVTFVRADAQVADLGVGSFDVATSSFGAMFFGDPVAAFANLGRSLAPDGRLALLAWRSLAENEWLTGLRSALALGRDLPVPPPQAPTPFALADPDRVREILSRAGFVDIALEPIDEAMELGDDVPDALEFAATMGIVEGLSHGLDEAQRTRVGANLEALFREHATPGGVLLGSASWRITARRG